MNHYGAGYGMLLTPFSFPLNLFKRDNFICSEDSETSFFWCIDDFSFELDTYFFTSCQKVISIKNMHSGIFSRIQVDPVVDRIGSQHKGWEKEQVVFRQEVNHAHEPPLIGRKGFWWKIVKTIDVMIYFFSKAIYQGVETSEIDKFKGKVALYYLEAWRVCLLVRFAAQE